MGNNHKRESVPHDINDGQADTVNSNRTLFQQDILLSGLWSLDDDLINLAIRLFDRILPTPSIWPVTKWPPILVFGRNAGSRLTLSLTLSSPRFEDLSVSSEISNDRALPLISTTVRQVPFTGYAVAELGVHG